MFEIFFYTVDIFVKIYKKSDKHMEWAFGKTLKFKLKSTYFVDIFDTLIKY